MGGSTIPVSERLERDMLRALHEAADATTREQLGLKLEEIDGTLVSIAAREPALLLNRVLGLGLQRPACCETVRAIRERYRDAGIAQFQVHLHPAAQPPNIGDLLVQVGLGSDRRWVHFERGPEPPPEPTSTLAVCEIDGRDAREFGRIVARAYGLTPAAAALFAGLADHPGVRLYMSFAGDEPAGAGLLYIDGSDAWLDWGATEPAFRGRGSQRTLIARRIADAAEAGCTRLVGCTGESVPGDPQHAHHNIEWAGFRPVGLRENWEPT